MNQCPAGCISTLEFKFYIYIVLLSNVHNALTWHYVQLLANGRVSYKCFTHGKDQKETLAKLSLALDFAFFALISQWPLHLRTR